MLTTSNDYKTHSAKMEPVKKKGSKVNPNRTDKAGRTKIFYATTAGHLDKVQELVEMGANVNFCDNAGWTPLHEAALKGQYLIAKYLIECGANVNVQGFGQDTPLHDAAGNGFADIVKLLVEHGANVFALNEHNERPIDLCEQDDEAKIILQEKMDALDRLIARDENGQTLLHNACLEKNLEKVDKLIQQGANVNAQDYKQQATPLHLLCNNNETHLDIMKLLVKNSAVIDMTDINGNTPLHEASRRGLTDVVQFLIDKNANVYIENNNKQTPYDISTHPPVRQILTARMDEVRLEKEASNALDEIAVKTAKTKEPERQLTREERKIQNYMKAFANLNEDQPVTKRRKTSSEQIEQVPIVKKKGGRPPKPIEGNINKKDTSGRTQLHKYAVKGNESNVIRLLKAGADPNIADYAGWTPLHEAALEGHLNIVRVLLDHQAKVNVKGGNNDDTPLHDATENNHCDVVELLLERGADPFARNKNGAEPIDIAMEKNYKDILLVLEATNPVKNRKKRALEALNSKKNDRRNKMEAKSSSLDVQQQQQPKKRRLVQAADLEKIKSPKEEMEEKKVKQEEKKPSTSTKAISTKPISVKTSTVKEEEKKEENKEVVTVKIEPEEQKRYWNPRKHLHDHNTTSVAPADPHSPIPTPPPEPGMMSHKQKQDINRYLPLYTVHQKNIFYVVDYQVGLLLGMSDPQQFWSAYPDLPKRVITLEEKTRLWSHLKSMLIQQDRQAFLDKLLYFTPLDDVVTLIKKNFLYLHERLITITLDLSYQEKKEEEKPTLMKQRSLPPKMRMKLGILKPHSSS